MLEPKARNEMADADVLAKKDAAVRWCEHATRHSLSNGGKPWQYALIPHDAIGAIGIARAFTYGGYRKNQLLYDPNGRTKKHRSFSEYKRKPTASTIHHFYEKLLLLKDLMNTRTAKKLAHQRHAFMERYLKQFFEEW